MYTLKDISTASLLVIPYGTQYNATYMNAITTLKAYSIRNYAELESMIQSGNQSFQNPYLHDWLHKAKTSLQETNKLGKDILRYSFDAYQTSEYDEFTLNVAESQINASKLPLTSPLNIARSTNERLAKYSIHDLKYLLQSISMGGKNAFTSNFPSFGTAKTQKVVDCIHLLEEQLLRIASTTPDYQRTHNLFLKDANLKRQMIMDDLTNIILEFLEGGNSYIFGQFSDSSKESLKAKATNPTNAIDLHTRDKIINMIADYTISEELEPSEARIRALKRFQRKN